MTTSRRRDKRVWYLLLGMFVAVFLFSFLAQKFNKVEEDVDAASLANFDPGNIISDYQMSNYKSMTEAQIQSFLKSKNSCNDRDMNKYVSGKKISTYSETYPPYTWHVKDGRFVCMADEKIKSETAAHIIYQTAQDYRINPQVLIVLLQKEQGLVTDTFPNSFQYRSATGYGCPDTAACSTKYYGFKNQVRNAAAMFRTVLDGGWTNYPVGKNYIQYSPNAACGGSIVNIKNRATSALYRYTPYQPNKAALAAGYGTANCGAYGNRNFYLYFQDWFGGATQELKSTRIVDGTYYIQAAADNSFAVDVDGGSTKEGANIQLYKSNKTAAQQWKITYNSKTDDYSIVNQVSGKSLDVDAAKTTNGANVQTWTTNESCAQRWKLVGTGGNGLKILSACSSKALDISGGSIKNGSNIQIWDDNASSAQKWVLRPVDEIESGLYYISSALNSNQVIDISGGSHNAKNGTNIQLWERNYSGAQRWYIEKTADGYYTITNKQSGKSFDVKGAGIVNGTNVQAYQSNQSCAQKWQIMRRDDNYIFISACSFKVLDLSAGNIKNGSNVQIYDSNYTKAQQWQLTPVEIVSKGDYVIKARIGENKVVDLAGGSSRNGTNVQIYTTNNTNAQKWEIMYDSTTDLYKIRNSGTKKDLDVSGASKKNGANVQSWDANSTCAQRWNIARINNEYVIFSACSGLALDVKGASEKNGTNVQIYTSNSTNAQRWVLSKTISD